MKPSTNDTPIKEMFAASDGFVDSNKNKGNSRMKTKNCKDYLVESRNYWWNDDYIELLSRRLNLNSCNRVADIGCGNGLMGFLFAKHLSNKAKVYGVDIDEGNLEDAYNLAQKVKTENDVSFEFKQGDAHHIPLEDASFDLAFCQTLLIHVKSPLEVINEMKRITKEDGWIVALEPNNLAANLIFDNYNELDYNIPDMLELVEVRLRFEKGKKILGEGVNSLGDAVPDLFLKAGLKDIQVWIADKALSVIPPYDSVETKLRVAQLIKWFEASKEGAQYEETLKYYLAGGGSEAKFNEYWQKFIFYSFNAIQRLKKGEYISSGGGLLYIVAGRK